MRCTGARGHQWRQRSREFPRNPETRAAHRIPAGDIGMLRETGGTNSFSTTGGKAPFSPPANTGCEDGLATVRLVPGPKVSAAKPGSGRAGKCPLTAGADVATEPRSPVATLQSRFSPPSAKLVTRAPNENPPHASDSQAPARCHRRAASPTLQPRELGARGRQRGHQLRFVSEALAEGATRSALELGEGVAVHNCDRAATEPGPRES